MKPEKDLLTPCLVRKTGNDQVLSGSTDESVEESVFVKSLRKLNGTALSEDEIKGLRQKKTDALRYFDVTVVDSALRVVEDQIQDLELEIEMLSLRKRALKRRQRLLERISKSLHESGGGQKPV